MRTLPDFTHDVDERFNACMTALAPVLSSNTMLEQQTKANLEKRCALARERYKTQLADLKVKIMLYGVYNSGKSTLLNALMRQKVASVADRVETAVVSKFQWNNYEFRDTPGIDAPAEHETISKESLKECQVILFVVSMAGTFESEKIFQEMKRIIDCGKRLIIVANNKGGPASNADIADTMRIREKIYQNLVDVGVPESTARSFKLIVVNAKHALDGHLENEERLLKSSNIAELESAILDELQDTSEFDTLRDILHNLAEAFGECSTILAGVHKDGVLDKLSEKIQEIRTQTIALNDYVATEIDTECSRMGGELFREIPLDGSSVEPDVIKSRHERIYENYAKNIHSQVKIAVQQRLAHLVQQLDGVVQDSGMNSTTKPSADDLHDVLAKQPELVSPDKVVVDDKNWADHAGDVAVLLPTLPKIPLPLPPYIVPLVAAACALAKLLFGKSEAECERERMEGQAAAQRRADEENAARKQLWIQELKERCQDMANQFIRDSKRNIAEYIHKYSEQLIRAAEERCQKGNKDVAAIQAAQREIQTQISLMEGIRQSLTSRQKSAGN